MNKAIEKIEKTGKTGKAMRKPMRKLTLGMVFGLMVAGLPQVEAASVLTGTLVSSDIPLSSYECTKDRSSEQICLAIPKDNGNSKSSPTGELTEKDILRASHDSGEARSVAKKNLMFDKTEANSMIVMAPGDNTELDIDEDSDVSKSLALVKGPAAALLAAQSISQVQSVNGFVNSALATKAPGGTVTAAAAAKH
jgi:hypothetical protein